MARLSIAVGVVCLLLGSACLPPAYEPEASERFWGLMALEKWKKDEAKPGAPDRNWKTYAMTALVTWRLGRDAPLPRAWAEGPCMVTEGTWADTTFAPPEHGTITLTGATSEPQKLVAYRDTWGVPDLVDDNVWPEGRELTVSATGGALGAFSFTSTVPAVPQVSSVDFDGLKPEELHVSRSAPLTVHWTPQSGEVLVTFVQIDSVKYEFFHTIWCSFPGMDGSGTVPAAALGTFVDKSKTYLTHMYVGTVVRQPLTVGPVDYELRQWSGRAVRITPDL